MVSDKTDIRFEFSVKYCVFPGSRRAYSDGCFLAKLASRRTRAATEPRRGGSAARSAPQDDGGRPVLEYVVRDPDGWHEVGWDTYMMISM